jgi:hypothetical protein
MIERRNELAIRGIPEAVTGEASAIRNVAQVTELLARS